MKSSHWKYIDWGEIAEDIVIALLILVVAIGVEHIIHFQRTTTTVNVIDVPAVVTDKDTYRSVGRVGKVWMHHTHYRIYVVDERNNDDRTNVSSDEFEQINVGDKCAIRYITHYNSWVDRTWDSTEIILPNQ